MHIAVISRRYERFKANTQVHALSCIVYYSTAMTFSARFDATIEDANPQYEDASVGQKKTVLPALQGW